MFRTALALAASALLSVLVVGCTTTPDTAGAQALQDQDVKAAVARFKYEDTSLRRFFDDSYGYAVFPKVGKAAFIVGGAYGRGQVFEQGDLVGHCDLTQGTVGLAAGGQEFSQIIFFEYKEALDHFKTGNFAFAAQASAAIVSEGGAADAKYDRGVAVFSIPRGGLMAEAAIGGQKFRFEPLRTASASTF